MANSSLSSQYRRPDVPIIPALTGFYFRFNPELQRREFFNSLFEWIPCEEFMKFTSGKDVEVDFDSTWCEPFKGMEDFFDITIHESEDTQNAETHQLSDQLSGQSEE